MDSRARLLYVVVVALCIVALIATGLSAWLRSDSSGGHEQDHHEESQLFDDRQHAVHIARAGAAVYGAVDV